MANQYITIHKDVITFIEQESKLYPRVETGGIIAGTGSVDDGNVVISKASECGPKAIHKRYLFSRDTEHCQNDLDNWVVESNGKVDYLGEWHKHMERIPKPSPEDLATMKKISLSQDYHVVLPILIIIGKSNKSKSMKVYFIDRNGKWLENKWKSID